MIWEYRIWKNDLKLHLLVGHAEEILGVIMKTNYAIHNPKKCSQLKLWFEINIVYVIYASGWNVSLFTGNKRARHVS